MTVYRFVDDKVVCLMNAITILTRLLETIFGVVGADELMDGINMIVILSRVPQLKLHLQLIDYYYECPEESQSAFESIKLRVRGIIAFIKTCVFSDFANLPSSLWQQYITAPELDRPRRQSELSSDDELRSEGVKESAPEETESVASNVLSEQSIRSVRSLFEKKTKKIIDGKWMECLDPLPPWTNSKSKNDELAVGARPESHVGSMEA